MATHSGLGLSMVQGFAEQSAGFVEARSQPAKGTTVALYFPVLTAKDLSPTAAETSDDPAAEGSRVLLVEDDNELRGVVTTLLTDLGYEVRTAANGKEALSFLAGKERVDLLFTDLILPGGLTGMDLAQQARTELPELKVLYTTGYADVARATSDTGLPREDLLLKPYRKESLAHKLSAVLSA